MTGELGGTSVTKVIVMRTFVLSIIVDYTSVTGCSSFRAMKCSIPSKARAFPSSSLCSFTSKLHLNRKMLRTGRIWLHPEKELLLKTRTYV